MKHLRKNGGFTLVELMVSIAIGSLVTLAASSVLLLGVRLNAQSSQTVEKQNTTRIMMSVLEKITTEGTIKGVKTQNGQWKVMGADGYAILAYDSSTKTISTGSGAVMMEDVEASSVNLTSDGLLTFEIENDQGTYSASAYCRMTAVSNAEFTPEQLRTEAAAHTGITQGRLKFLDILINQLGSKGTIIPEEPEEVTPAAEPAEEEETETGEDTEPAEVYYSQWYAEAQGISWGDPDNANGWNANTPWCACYISWGLNQVQAEVTCPDGRSHTEEETDEATGEKTTTVCYWYANVDNFRQAFIVHKAGTWYGKESTYMPIPGDLVFFDWDSGNDPEHAGVVLAVDEHVYTIEGNTAGTVAIRKYPADDSRIIGYGVLPWK